MTRAASQKAIAGCVVAAVAIAGSTDEVPIREALWLADLHLHAAKSGGRDCAQGPAGLILARKPG